MKLMIMRHGHAEPFVNGYQDETRALTEYGVSSVKISAQRLVGQEPELVLVSPLLRTQQTADLVVNELSARPERQSAEWLRSEASVADAISELSRLETDSVLLVSHMPFVSMLLEYLTGERAGFEPADVVRVDMEYVSRGQGELTWLTE